MSRSPGAQPRKISAGDRKKRYPLWEPECLYILSTHVYMLLLKCYIYCLYIFIYIYIGLYTANESVRGSSTNCSFQACARLIYKGTCTIVGNDTVLTTLHPATFTPNIVSCINGKVESLPSISFEAMHDTGQGQLRR